MSPISNATRPISGTTIAGFFSDEPGFYNCIDTVFNFNAIVGKEKCPCPGQRSWRSSLLSDGNTCGDLVRLWYDTSADDDAAFRYRYMDAVTRLYEKNFSLQLGDWCRSPRGGIHRPYTGGQQLLFSCLGPSCRTLFPRHDRTGYVGYRRGNPPRSFPDAKTSIPQTPP